MDEKGFFALVRHTAATVIVLLVILIVFLSIAPSTAVRCYECTNENGTVPDCSEPFPDPVPLINITILECEKYCIKSVTMETVMDISGDETTTEFYATSRYCGAECLEVCYKEAPLSTMETCTYCCEGDLCNGAAGVHRRGATGQWWAPILLVFTLCAYW